jgi:hypothetical protein
MLPIGLIALMLRMEFERGFYADSLKNNLD